MVFNKDELFHSTWDNNMIAIALHEGDYVSTYYNFNYFGQNWKLDFKHRSEYRGKSDDQKYKSIPGRLRFVTDLDRIYIRTDIKLETSEERNESFFNKILASSFKKKINKSLSKLGHDIDPF